MTYSGIRKEKNTEYARLDRARHLEVRRAHARARKKYRYDNDPVFKLKTLIRNRISKILRPSTKPATSMQLVGCSAEELKEYLTQQFTTGMSWNNYGKWHVDHRESFASIDIDDAESVRRVCHYSNLQPLWAADNIRKGG